MLSFLSIPELRPLALKAARAWNDALRRPALVEAPSVNNADVLVMFSPIDRIAHPGRVAEYDPQPPPAVIRLDTQVKWRVTRWQRWLGLGDEDAYAALLHEFGHALGLPHSSIVSHVMHAELGSTVISAEEAAQARQFLGGKVTA